MAVCESVFESLITNRVAGAYYNASDLNRVANAVNCLAELLDDNLYLADFITLSSNWTEDSIFFDTDGETFVEALNIVRDALNNSQLPSYPQTFDALNFSGANQIEEFLGVMYQIIQAIQEAYKQVGTFQVGGVLL